MFSEFCLKMITKTVLFSTIEYNEITLSIPFKIFSTKINKNFKKKKISKKGKSIYGSATKLFENYNFSCEITSLLN